jgi:hypothetical protein
LINGPLVIAHIVIYYSNMIKTPPLIPTVNGGDKVMLTAAVLDPADTGAD